MFLPMRLFYGKDYSVFMNFKNNLPFFSGDDIQQIYEKSSHGMISRDTDLNNESIYHILKTLEGDSVLDIGCGTGYLANLISSQGKNVVGADFVITESAKKRFPNIEFVETTIEQTGFKDNQFDTVISAHTIEHVANVRDVIEELRRISSKKLIIVLPCQRYYRYTFDLHVNFYPYEFDVLREIDPRNRKYKIQKVKGDWVYEEWK